MQPDACAGLLVTLLLILASLRLLLHFFRRLGEGFWEGFWAAIWSRVFLGRHSPGTTNPLGCLAMVLLIPFVALVLLALVTLLLIGLLGSLRI